MTFGESIKSCLNGYVKFDGRAPRSEYWWFWLFGAILLLIANAIELSMLNKHDTLEILVNLAIFLPALSVSVRRLHDLNKSGWWYDNLYSTHRCYSFNYMVPHAWHRRNK